MKQEKEYADNCIEAHDFSRGSSHDDSALDPGEIDLETATKEVQEMAKKIGVENPKIKIYWGND